MKGVAAGARPQQAAAPARRRSCSSAPRRFARSSSTRSRRRCAPRSSGWTPVQAQAGPAEILQAVTPVLEEAETKDETEVIERWREEAGRNASAASGWEQTLEASSDARVELLLFHARAPTARHFDVRRAGAPPLPKEAARSTEPGSSRPTQASTLRFIRPLRTAARCGRSDTTTTSGRSRGSARCSGSS